MGNKKHDDRMIHIRLSAEEHKALKVLSAKQDTTTQDIVALLVKNFLNITKVS